MLLTILHIKPLNVFPLGSFWKLFMYVFEFIRDIRWPSDILRVNRNVFAIAILQRECVIENTLSNKTAWNGWISVFQSFSAFTLPLVRPEIANGNDWITIGKILYSQVFSVQLFTVSGFYIPSMVLVEVIQLVIDIDWSLNCGFNVSNSKCATIRLL